MSRIHPGMVLVLVALLSGCAGQTRYHRGTAKRIDSQVRTGAATVEAEVEQTMTGELYVVVFERVDSEVEKVLVFNTVEVVREYVWWGEFIEVPLGPIMLVAAPPLLLLSGASSPPDTEFEKGREPWNTLTFIFGMINPAQSAVTGPFVRHYDSDKELFKTKPVVVKFTQGRPLEGAAVSYQWKDEAGQVIASGQGTTDLFGRVPVEAPDGEPALLEFRVGSGPVVSVEQATPNSQGQPPAGPEAPPAQPPAPPDAPPATPSG